MPGQLEQRIAEFTQWRDQLVSSVDEFRSWQDAYGRADIEQTLRIYDLVESLRNDRIRLAFMGESAAHKIGLINALLFPDVAGGLLPAGDTCAHTCATEIFFDANDPPYVRLLPIETRKRPESIAALRRNTIEWVTMRLDTSSPESIATALAALAETRDTSPDEVRALNLWNEGAGTRIPAWRYALVNLPHPTLKSGLMVFYTPGLQMLSAEPEIGIRMTAGAQSLLMALGETLSQETQLAWKQYGQSSRARKCIVVSGELAADARANIAKTLAVAPENIYAGTPTATTQALEKLHAEQIVPERQALLLSAVSKEIGPLVLTARQAAAARFIATVKEMQDLSSTAGKNRDDALKSLNNLEAERREYQRNVNAFNVTFSDLMSRGQDLLSTLHDDRIAELLDHDREFIEGAWSTSGMWKNMQGLFDYFAEQVEKILNYAGKLTETVDGIYETFHQNYGLTKMVPPQLSLQKYLEETQALKDNARRFCHDPVNIATFKPYLVKKFYDGLVEEARHQFELTRLDTERWLRGVLGPLNAQITERQSLMLKRVENLRNLKNNMSSVQDRLRQLDQQKQALKKQSDQIDQLRTRLALTPTPATTTESVSAPVSAPISTTPAAI